METSIFTRLARKLKTQIRFFPISTFFGLIALLIVVSGLGIFASIKLGNVATTISDAARPDDRLLKVKEVVADLNSAENSVKTFSITLDQTHLLPYYTSALAIDAELDTLLAVSTQDVVATHQIERLDSLVHEKFALMESILTLQENEELDAALTELATKLRRADSKVGRSKPQPIAQATSMPIDSAQTKPKPPTDMEKILKKNMFFNPLFIKPLAKADPKSGDSSDPTILRQDSTKTKVAISETATPKFDSTLLTLPKEISRDLGIIRKLEEERLRIKKTDELKFARQDQELSTQIAALVREIETKEQQAMEAKTARAQGLAQEVNGLILYFCLALGILLLLVGVGIYFYFRTTSRFNQSTDAARQEAERLAKARETFIATMSHEIRTPMNAIVGFTNIILNSPLRPEQREKLQMVSSSADHLLGLVNTVLDYSKLEAGSMQFEQLPFSLEKSLRLSVEWMLPDANSKGLSLKLELPTDLPECLLGDVLRLRQVLLNLLGNAIKFTEQGEIVLKAETSQADESRLRIRFAVQDSGIGIPQDKQAAVWEEFEQVDGSISRRYGGSGLGLAITKRLVTQQGGIIGMESELGKGTTVWFELEFAFGDPAQLEQEEAQIYQPVLGKRVLIADDEPFNRRLLGELLQSRRIEFHEVANGSEALVALEAHHFDLVLMDLRMPEMGGIEAIGRIRKGMDEAKCNVPIVVISAAANKNEAAQWIAAGCDAVLPKPFQETEFWKTVEPFWFRNSPEKPQDSTPLFSLEALQRMSQGNRGFVLEMIDSYIHSAKNGLATILAAIENQDETSIAEACHKLAAPTKHLAATELYQALKALEEAANQKGDAQTLALLGRKVQTILDQLLPALEKARTEIQENAPAHPKIT